MSTEASKESMSELLLKEITGSKFCDQHRSRKEVSVRLAFFSLFGGVVAVTSNHFMLHIKPQLVRSKE